jgi:1-aminocyclopropane-1-carboxylate deaminase
LNENINIQCIPSFSINQLEVDVLRLDDIHPIISGNKWFKLKYYVQFAQANQAKTIASFGGPYSNHLVALAYVAKQNNLKSIGYVRANGNEPITPSLQEAVSYGMELRFLGRAHFQKLKNELIQNNSSTAIFFVDEGGYGTLGAKGAATILNNEKTNNYSHIVCAVGTGTMMAGLINASNTHQHIIGIPVLKNEQSIAHEINWLLTDTKKNYTLLHDFHLGGYAKTTQMQFDFMNQLWETEKIPTDIVYTSKLFMAMKNLIHSDYFSSASKILIVHSGGLQGNRSVAVGTLLF